MKKTLLITLDFPPRLGGVANYLENLCSRLPNDKIIVLAPSEKTSKQFDSEQNYKIYRKKLFSTFPLIWPKWFFLIPQVLKIIRKEKIEQILVGQILPIGTVALIINLLWKIPYFISTHALDITILKNSSRRAKIASNILKRAKKIITVSDFTKKELIDLATPEDKIVIISPATDIYQNSYPDQKEAIKKRYNLFNKKIILTIGRIVERKGHLTVLKSLSEVIKQYSNLVYLIGSSGPYSEILKQYVNDHNLNNIVIFTGEITKEELPSFYQIADIFVMTSLELKNRDVEGFGIVYLEANAFSKPVIATKTGGIADAVINEQTGLLVNPANKNELTDAIIQLLKNPNLTKKLGEQGRKRVINQFNWDARIKQLEAILT